MPSDRDQTLLSWDSLKSTGEAVAVFYRHGAKVSFTPTHEATPPGRRANDIRDQSPQSRRRAAFAFGNASCEWGGMSLLTWREKPEGAAVKRALRRFSDAHNDEFGEGLDGWILEIQKRGVPHFHIFHSAESAFWQTARAGTIETRVRRGVETQIARGDADNWLVPAWARSSRQPVDGFMRGGLIEYFRSGDAAGRYVAKESSKREQKKLPDEYGSIGRWWHLARRHAPEVVAVGRLDLDRWPWNEPISHVWDANQLAPCIVDGWRPDDPGGREIVPHIEVD